MSRILKNYAYQTAFQVLNLILPFVIIPYISKVLGPDNLGSYSYEITISTFFYTFLNLGLNLYGTREVSYRKNNRQTISLVFLKILNIKILTFLLVIFIFPFIDNSSIWYLMIVNVAYLFFDFSWFLQALQNFKILFLRNLVLKIVTVAFIFIFVKGKSDLFEYASILLIGNLFSAFVLLPEISKNVNFSLYRFAFNKSILKIVLLSFPLFIPQIFIDLYNNIDKFVLKNMSGNEQVGYYDMVQKIVRMMLFFLSSISTVLFPEISYRIKNKQSYEDLLSNSFVIVLYFSIIVSCFLSVFSKTIVTVLLDDSYLESIPILQIYSFMLIPISLGGVIGTQYMLPMGLEKVYKYPIIAGLFVCVLCNIMLIPQFDAIGSAVSALISEFTVFTIMIIIANRTFNFNFYLIKEWRIYLILFVSFFYSFKLNSIEMFVPLYFVYSLTYFLFIFIVVSYKNPLIHKLIKCVGKNV